MKTFKPYTPDQLLLLPPALQDWLPEGHLARFLSDVVDHALDLRPILAAYETGEGRRQPPYHPALMVKLLLYAYCTGMPSSQQIERATYEKVPYRVLAANQHPDQVFPLLRPEDLGLLLGLADERDAFRSGEAGQVFRDHVVLPLVDMPPPRVVICRCHEFASGL
ncbi:MAG: transposase [Candidatus Rokubacteria bacterium]|nr:transposase [Candidatus Rokubacteria bacterium]